jgi:hypothetical protein
VQSGETIVNAWWRSFPLQKISPWAQSLRPELGDGGIMYTPANTAIDVGEGSDASQKQN